MAELGTVSSYLTAARVGKPAPVATPLDTFTTVVVPLVAAAGTGVRLQVAGGVSIGFLVAAALLPVWIFSLPRFRGIRLLLTLGMLAVASGIVLSLTDTVRELQPWMLNIDSLRTLGFLGAVGVLLWARSCVGSALTAAAYGAGLLLNALIGGIHDTNPWKFSYSTPITILMLGLAARSTKRSWEIAVLGVLAVVSLSADSRSLTAMLSLTAVVVLWQMRRGRWSQRRPRPWLAILFLGLVSLAVFQIMQALTLEGALGESAQQRSQAQIQNSGSILAGGRPEFGAALALIRHQPWGFGNGLLATSQDVWIAKQGMSELNYDPNNGYVEGYMFGLGYEVHSVLGDLWINFGILGAVFALGVVGYCLYSAASQVSTRTASALVVFLSLQSGWNLLFSPILGSSHTLFLALAMAALPVGVPVGLRRGAAPGFSGSPSGVEAALSGALPRT